MVTTVGGIIMSRKYALMAAAWLLVSSPAFAQVQRVVVETEGMSAVCLPPLEGALRMDESIYKYATSVAKQMFSVVYYSGEKFDPLALRKIANQGEAYVLKFHVSAVGKLEKDGDRRFFVAGENRFLVIGMEGVPPGVPIGVIGLVDDEVDPMTMTPDDVQVLTDSPTDESAPPRK